MLCHHCAQPIPPGRAWRFCSRICNTAARNALVRAARVAGKKCKECKKAAIGIGRSVYCSTTCLTAAQARQLVLAGKRLAQERKVRRQSRPPCIYCGGPIPVARLGKAKYCSDRCRIAVRDAQQERLRQARFAARLHRKCVQCAEPIPPEKVAGTKYCSDRCQDLATHAAERMREGPLRCSRCRRLRDKGKRLCDHCRIAAEVERRKAELVPRKLCSWCHRRKTVRPFHRFCSEQCRDARQMERDRQSARVSHVRRRGQRQRVCPGCNRPRLTRREYYKTPDGYSRLCIMCARTKHCTKCHRRKPLAVFATSAAAKGRRNTRCRACTSAEAMRIVKAFQQRDPVRYRRMMRGVEARRECKRHQADPNPTLTCDEWDWLLSAWGMRCAYCRCRLTVPDGRTSLPTDWSREHVIPTPRGRLNRRNIVPACRDCNTRKHSKALDVFLPPARHARFQQMRAARRCPRLTGRARTGTGYERMRIRDSRRSHRR